MYSSAAMLNHYQNNSVMTASPVELVIMLYDGLLKQMKLAALFMDEHYPEQAGKHLIQAQNIVSELLKSLDFKYDIAKQLMSLYDYIMSELVKANITKSPEHISDLIEIVENLRDAWQTIKGKTGRTYFVEE